jgi:hypothetical protein
VTFVRAGGKAKVIMRLNGACLASTFKLILSRELSHVSYFSYIVIQMPVRKFEDPKIEQQILNLLQETAKPTTTDYVATNLKISWSTARMMLLSMALHGKIGILETTNSCVFLLKKTEPAQALNQAATSMEEASTLTESAASNE